MYDASSRKDIRKAEKQASIAESLTTDYLRRAMSTIEGRAWFYELLEFCGIFDGTFVPDALALAFRAGARNVGLKTFAELQSACPDHYLTMMREHHARSTAAERSVEPILGRDDTRPEPEPADEDGATGTEPDRPSDDDSPYLNLVKYE